jgi:carbon monoxide dehydrogenase subunit G
VKLEQSFEVDAPLQAVWEALINVERVAPCLPGAEIIGQDESGAYEGTFSAKVGPASVAYKGTLKMDKIDEANHTAVMLANGSDRRGQGGAKATIISTLAERDGGGTKVDIDTDYSITGRLARLGRGGMIQDVGNRLLRDFATCLEQRLLAEGAVEQPAAGATPAVEGAPTPDAQLSTAAPATTATEQPAAPAPPVAAPKRAVPPPPQAKPISGISLILGVLWDRLRKLAGRSPRKR